MSEEVQICIDTPEYECPDHYQWYTAGPFSRKEGIRTIPRETFERWSEIQAAWDGMQDELARLYALKPPMRKPYQVIP